MLWLWNVKHFEAGYCYALLTALSAIILCLKCKMCQVAMISWQVLVPNSTLAFTLFLILPKAHLAPFTWANIEKELPLRWHQGFPWGETTRQKWQGHAKTDMGTGGRGRLRGAQPFPISPITPKTWQQSVIRHFHVSLQWLKLNS